MPAHFIHPAQAQDAMEIARLASQLGYPTSREAIEQRLQRLLTSANDLVLVAETAEGTLVGWIHAFLSQLLESDYRVEIGGLIVDEKARRWGIGRELVGHIEKWAIERGSTQVSVRCRTTRFEAHQFYEGLGYRPAKTQTAFRKSLSLPGQSLMTHR